jgi:hypothetical protein
MCHWLASMDSNHDPLSQSQASCRLNERPMLMERTGGFEPPFSAPFTYHRFEAGVGYVRIVGRGSGPRSRITTLRGSYPSR